MRPPTTCRTTAPFAIQGGVLDPEHPQFAQKQAALADMTDTDLDSYVGYLDALCQRGQAFIALGATATDRGTEGLRD